MKSPAISVCIPMYNAASFLKDCIDSILSQSFTDFELLIVDDGSTDDSKDIVRSYHDNRIRLIENEHDYIGSLNILLKEAKGKYIARMDADDVMCPNRLSIQYGFLEENTSVDIVCGEIKYLGDSIEYSYVKSEIEVTLELMKEGNIIPHPTVMMRASIIEENKLQYDCEYIYAEDYNLWVDALALNLRIVKLPQILINYRLSNTQISYQKKKEQFLNTEKVLCKIYRILYPPFSNIMNTWSDDFYVSPNQTGRSNKMTVIIPFLNEREEVVNTLKSIRDNVGNNVEIIIIDDCSDDEWPYKQMTSPFTVSYVKNKCRIGVAACRDLGVMLCQTPYFLLLDAHMRFYDGIWPERLTSLLEKDDRTLLCCQTRFLSKDKNKVIRHNTECPDVFGAFSTFNIDKYWPDIEWNQKEQQVGLDVEPIGNVLGAGYAASKRYWMYIRGLQGLRKYGCDEALMSFKVWREGGRCLLVKDVVIGHIYRDKSPFKHYMAEEISNNLLVSYLTFSQQYYCYASAIAFCKDRKLYAESMKILQAYWSEIEMLKKYLESIYTKTFDSILRNHRCRLLNNDEIKEQSHLYNLVNDFIMEHPSKRIGLYEGITGQLIWFCLYRKWSDEQSLETTIQHYWTGICEAIEKRMLSWNFAEGITGVGWACMYLYTRQLLDDYPERLLCKIDNQIQEIDLNKISVPDFALGAGGILAYVMLRNSTGQPKWESSYLEGLSMISQKIIADSSSNLSSVFYAMYYLDMQKNGIKKNTYYPRINEWLLSYQHISSNVKYWKPTIFNGCIGAVIGLIDAECNNKNI